MTANSVFGLCSIDGHCNQAY